MGESADQVDGAAASRQVQRGAPGAAAVLLRAAAAGGAPSRDALLATVSGAERQALSWALRNAGEGRLTPARCRQVARELSVKPAPAQLDLFAPDAEVADDS